MGEVTGRLGTVAALAGALRDTTAVLVGQSGVSKSSLANALVPGLRLATNEVRAADGKERHTMTATSLYELPGGGRLLDTPGIRQFGLRGMPSEEILRHFGEFAMIECCAHLPEPECGVRAAVATGVLSQARYRSYVRIVSEVEAWRRRSARRRTGRLCHRKGDRGVIVLRISISISS